MPSSTPRLLMFTAMTALLTAPAFAAAMPMIITEEMEIDHNLDGLPPAERALHAGVPAEDVAIPSAVIPATPAIETTSKPGKPLAREIPLIEDARGEAQSHADVSFVTGGIGEDERALIEAARADYNLYVTSSTIGGDFVDTAQVTITRQLGRTAETMLTVDMGPLLYVRLPAGNYLLTASRDGQHKQQRFAVRKKGAPARISLGWKE